MSLYLTVLHFAGIAPTCPVSGAINCEAVLSSSYALIAGTPVPTSAAGIVWFGVSALLWAWRFGPVHLAWSAVGLFTSGLVGSDADPQAPWWAVAGQGVLGVMGVAILVLLLVPPANRYFSAGPGRRFAPAQPQVMT